MANERKATLLIELKDLASRGLATLNDRIESLMGNVGIAAAAFAAFTAAVVKGVHAAGEQEVATKKLETALFNQGVASKGAAAEMVKYAGELQKITTFSDDAIIENQALIASFGAVGEKNKQVLKGAMDLSAGMGIDLRTASMLVSKAFQGQTEILGRYGIRINDSIPPSEKFAAVLAAIETRFGGSAAAQAETYAGKLTIVKNQFGELQEQLGDRLLPGLKILLDATLRGIDYFDRFAKNIEKAAKAMSGMASANAGAASGKGIFEFFSGTKGEDALKQADKLQDEMTARVAKAQEKRAAIADAKAGEEAAIEAEKQKKIGEEIEARRIDEEFGEAEQARKSIERYQLTGDEIEAFKVDEQAKNLERQGLGEAADSLRKAAEVDRAKKAEALKTQTVMQGLNMVASLTTAKSKELQAIGKTAAIAMATMDTFVAANKALSQLGVFGPPMAALIVAAGMANVARIAGVPLAEGGVVMPRSGGTLATIGEAGHAEAVIPLDDDRAREKLGGAMGGEVNINIQAGMIIADKTSVIEFARMIDEELFKLNRNRQSVAF